MLEADGTLPKEIAPDFCHPAEKGYQIWADAIRPFISEPCINEDADDCLNCLAKRIKMIGEEVAYNDYGDSKHYINRKLIV